MLMLPVHSEPLPSSTMLEVIGMQQSTNKPRERSRRVERFDTVVVGAGQAGLAVGYHLAKRDMDFMIVESEARVGESWRKRWDSLRLFSTAKHDSLPGMCFPTPPEHLPDKDEVADYLERYAERFDLPSRLGTRVDSLGWNGKRYVLVSGGEQLEADNVVVATGPFQRPRVPELAARLSPAIHQLHSSEYRNPFELPEGPVLVVGAGNSGAQIALELSRSRKVWLAGREPGHLPRRLLGRDIFDLLWPVLVRLTADSRSGRFVRARIAHGDPLVGIPASSFARAGVARLGRVAEERGGFPVCDGRIIEPRVVIWSTGYRSDYRWIDLPVLDERGSPRHHRGVAIDLPGLYFAGLAFQHNLTSSLLGGVGEDAGFIADQIAGRSEAAGVGVTRSIA